MKKLFLALTVASGVLAFTSCNTKNKDANVETVTVEDVVAVAIPNEIVTDSISNAQGEKMYFTFNNTKGTMDLVYKGENHTLMQDTTASGIRYKNNQYVYEEWQGKVTLKKDGRVVFEKQK